MLSRVQWVIVVLALSSLLQIKHAVAEQKTPLSAAIVITGDNATRQALQFYGEPRLHDLITRVPNAHQMYWRSARLCTPELQNKLELKRKALIVQLNLLAGIYQRNDKPVLYQQAQLLKKQIQQWPLLATIQHGIEPDNLLGTPRDNWRLTPRYSHYSLVISDAPEGTHDVGLSHETSEGERFEVDQSGKVTPITPENAWQLTLQPGSHIFTGFARSQLPAGFSDINHRAVELLRYWQPGKALKQPSSPCQA